MHDRESSIAQKLFADIDCPFCCHEIGASYVCLQPRMPATPGPAGRGKGFSLSILPCETPHGALHPALRAPARETQGPVRAGLEEAMKMISGKEHTPMRQAERAGVGSAQRREGFILSVFVNTHRRLERRRNQALYSGAQ